MDEAASTGLHGRRARSALASSSRVELLDALQRRGACTVDELAAATGLHENTTREHLQRLIAEGYVRRDPGTPAGRGRPPMRYRSTTARDVREDPLAARRLEDSIAQAALVRALLDGYGMAMDDVPGSAQQHGTRIGRHLDDDAATERSPDDVRRAAPEGSETYAAHERQVLALDAHLDRMGFDPVLDPDTLTFDLWRCPFLELAQERPEVVCSVHLGLAQGVLEQVGGPVRAQALEPFVGPRHCALRLTTDAQS
ncbi:helix-turn-helix transcriptional regulator [Cellulomonas sp. P22]|uniref:helix-turn-helix transcriptional regulator n=1 Tax=Cellulomonas sp. P22 TaxID=3373189 RepID=UPI00378EA048